MTLKIPGWNLRCISFSFSNPMLYMGSCVLKKRGKCYLRILLSRPSHEVNHGLLYAVSDRDKGSSFFLEF